MQLDAPWWPPKVGDRLRGVWGPDPKEDPLLHVVSVFEHAGETFVVTVEWFRRRRRWNYEVQDIIKAHVGLVRPDGTPRKPVGG